MSEFPTYCFLYDGSPVGVVNPPSTWGRNFSFLHFREICQLILFCAFAKMLKTAHESVVKLWLVFSHFKDDRIRDDG